jgi:hypothetical protein
MWRLFWEDVPAKTFLTRHSYVQRSESIGGVFSRYFMNQVVRRDNRIPSTISIALECLLQATFVHACRCCEQNTKPRLPIECLTYTPLPVILITPAQEGLTIECVQQRELSPLGIEIFDRSNTDSI